METDDSPGDSLGNHISVIIVTLMHCCVTLATKNLRDTNTYEM